MSPLIWVVDIILWGLVGVLIVRGVVLTHRIKKMGNNPNIASVVQTYSLATIAFIFTLLITLFTLSITLWTNLGDKLDRIIEILIKIEMFLIK